jgi:hypothetical protein
MITIVFAAFLALAAIVAVTDWRRGVLMLVITGALQDPVRKLTPGSPFLLTMSVVLIYAAIIIAIQAHLQRALVDFAKRFATVWAALGITLFFIVLAAVNGLVTNGIILWRVPVASLFIYLAPLPAVLIGYLYIDREERLLTFVRVYCVVTSIAMIGTLLEYLRVDSRALGMVAQSGDYIRFLGDLQVRMLSGLYRGPDIMAWHAATLTCLAIVMVVRAGISRSAAMWSLTAAWGCFNTILSGRRKAIYMVTIFAAVFVWRYFRRLKSQQVAAFVLAALAIGFVVHGVASNENSSVYAKAALATHEELAQRLEGGLWGTIQESGYLGQGLGVATQGTYHFATADQVTQGVFGWQEGGLGKLAVELGVPGLLAAALLMWRALLMMNRIAAHPDVPGSSQIIRVALFALVLANIGNFLASAQAYSDPVLTLLTAFFAGALFGTARLDEQEPAPEPEPVKPQRVLAVVTD